MHKIDQAISLLQSTGKLPPEAEFTVPEVSATKQVKIRDHTLEREVRNTDLHVLPDLKLTLAGLERDNMGDTEDARKIRKQITEIEAIYQQ